MKLPKLILVTIFFPTLIWSGQIAGYVKRASDSTAIVNATVILTAGVLDGGKTASTDANGYYHIDSIGPINGYTLGASFSGYASGSISNVSVSASGTVTLSTIYLSPNVGTISGTVYRADSVNLVLKNAKIVFFVNGIKVDSVFSDSLGHYSKVLNAATYTMKSSLAGYRSNKGLLTRDTTVTVSFGQTTTSLVYLTPATGTINGTISHNAYAPINIQCGPIAGARVYLERRMGSAAGYNSWILIDSTITDAAGLFVFPGLIPATTTPTIPPATGTSYSASGGNYRVLYKALGFVPNYDTSAILTSTNPTAVVDLPNSPNSVVTANVTNLNVLVKTAITTACTTDIYQTDNSHTTRFNSASHQVSIVEIYDMNGVLHKTILVPAGESKIDVPSAFAKGFLLLVK